jgi:hypothetical protein
MKKRIVFGLLSLLTASLLISQSLVEASKQEQERREKLKGKNVKVVTNAELKAATKTSAVSVAAPEEAKPGAPGQAEPKTEEGAAAKEEAPPLQPPAEPEYSVRYAESVFPGWVLVENPDSALGPPDNRFAEISGGGVLDLEIEVNNGEGDDLAVYARPPEKLVGGGEGENQLESYMDARWRGDFRYAVLGKDSRGEWQEIGLGSGQNPDNFDLGALKSTKIIRIMFRGSSLPLNEGAKPQKLAGNEVTTGLDAIGALH